MKQLARRQETIAETIMEIVKQNAEFKRGIDAYAFESRITELLQTMTKKSRELNEFMTNMRIGIF